MSEWETLHRFYCILLQSKIRKERSDFAAVELSAQICRGLAKFLFASSQKCDSPLGGVSRFGFFTKLSGGTKRANDVRPYRCVAVRLWV